MHRRSFLKRAALTAGALSAARYLAFPNVLSAASRVTCSIARSSVAAPGETHLEQVIVNQKQRLVALVDRMKNKSQQKKVARNNYQIKTDNVLVFSDYRVMFDKIGGQIDAVFVAAPNHHHAAAAMMPCKRARSLLRKALCRDIAQAGN